MPYDTIHTYQETTEQHALRLKRSERWTKIRRRALLLKLEGLAPDEMQARMGTTNCPDYLARASVDVLLAELAVRKQGAVLAPSHGAELEHDLAAIQDAAQALGLDVTVRDLTRDLAGESNKLALAQAGIMIGHPPYGYRKEGSRVMLVAGTPKTAALIVIDPEEATVVIYLFDRYLEGYSFSQIAQELNAEGQRTRSGDPWNADTLRDMLRNPTYAGYVLYRGAEDRNRREAGRLYPGLHPAIVSWNTFCAAQDRRVQSAPVNPQPFWHCPWANAPQKGQGRP